MTEPQKISQWPAAGPIDGTERIPVVQGGASRGLASGALIEHISAPLREGLSEGALVYATKAAMDADRAHPENTLARVIADTAEVNGIYYKTGASGSGSWAKSADRVTGLEAKIPLAAREAVGTDSVSYASVDPVLPLSGYFNTSTGAFVANGSWRASDFITVRKGDKITLKAITHSQTAGNIAFFNNDQEFISAAPIGPNSVLSTVEYTAPQDGFVRVATRTGSAPEFSLAMDLLRTAITKPEADARYLSLTASDLAIDALSSTAASVVALPRAAQSSVQLGGRDTAGAVVSASNRRHRAITLDAGQTAYFGGLNLSGSGVPSAVFVGSDSVAVVVHSGVPRNGAVYPYSGEFIAPTAGTFYANQFNDPANPDNGYLFSDANGGIVSKERVLGWSDVGEAVVSEDVFTAYDASLNRSGEFVDVTGSAVMRVNHLFHASGYEVIQSGSSIFDEFATALVPVLAGDVVKFYGAMRGVAGGPARANQLDVRGDYVGELLGVVNPSPLYQTHDITATADGYVALLVTLKNGATIYDYAISRRSSSVLGDTVKGLVQSVAAVPAQIDAAIDTGVEPIVRTVVAEEFEDIAGDAIEQLVSDAIASSDVSGIARVDSVMDKLPVRLSMLNGYNSQTYTQNNIVEGGGYQYIVGVDELRNPFIMRRSLLGGAWEIFDLSTIPGNPFDAPNQPDSHNNFVMAITRDGHLLISGNQHTSPCRCVVSDNPHDMTAWTEVPFTTSGVTYPRFLTHPDGTTLGFWRETDRSYYMAEFNDATLTWGTKRLVIDQPVNPPDGAAGTRVYEQMLAIDAAGDLHLCWGYRAFPVAEGNYGMFYAKSSDKGQTFHSASGALSYSLPLTDVNSERIYTVDAMEGYVNQCGGCYDLNNRYHTVFWHNDPVTGFGRIMHVWFNGTVWKSEAVYHLDRQWPPMEGLLSGEFKRPHIICGQSGRLFVIYANLFQSHDQIRAIDVTTEGSPQDFCIIKFGVRQVQLALNIEFPIKNNELVMMLAKGAGGGGQMVWDNQGAYLVTVPLPVA